MAQGSTANVVAALASFLYPGLGQLTQGLMREFYLVFLLNTIKC